MAYSLRTGLFILLFATVLSATGCYDCKRNCNILKQSPLVCLVDSIADNPATSNAPTVFLTCYHSAYEKLFLREYEFPVLYSTATKGDSVTKEPNSLRFRLVKQDTIMYSYPVCDGKEVK